MNKIQAIAKKLFSGDDKNPLLDSLEKHRKEVKGSGDAPKKPPAGGEQPTQAEVDKSWSIIANLLQMFSATSTRDKLFLFIGTLCTIIHGASFPVLALLFGTISETFIVQSYGSQYNMSSNLNSSHSNHHKSNISGMDIVNKLMGDNSTQSNDITEEDMFGFIGDTLGSYGPQNPLTKSEFVDYADYLSLIYLGIGLIVFFASFIQTACWEWAADNQVNRIRQHFLYQVLRQDMSFFNTRSAGYLVVKLADDLERVREGIGHKFSIMLEYLSCFAFGAFFGLSTNWKLALIFGSSVPVILVKTLFVGAEISSRAVGQREECSKAGAISSEVLSQVRTVAAYGTEQDEQGLYREELEVGVDKANSKYNLIGYGTGLLYLVIYGAYAAGFYYACRQLSSHGISPRAVYTVFFCVSVGVLALENILAFVSTIANAYGSSRVIMSIINSNPTIDPYDTTGRKPIKIDGKIKFENVSFQYPEREDITIIKDLNLIIKSGDTVAIVGESGSGKSTIVNLIMRFYDPQSGNVLLDDINLKKLNLTWLREHIGIVAQNPTFDETTIYNNICGLNVKANFDQVKKAAEMACAHDFISKLPEGYDTIIGITARQLSSGQKQRIALARALIKDPAILILDEATSGLNVETAIKLHDNIKSIRAGRTTISLSHRLLHIQEANMIYVLKDGTVAESGTHEELMEKKALYFKMVKNENLLETLEAKPSEGVAPAPGEAKPATNDKPVEESTKPLEDKTTVEIDAGTAEYDDELKFPTIADLIQIITDESLWKFLTFGLSGAVVCGIVTPMFALVFSELFITFAEKSDQFYSDAMFWVKIVIGIGVVSAIGIFFRTIYICISGEYLALRLRITTYLSVLRQAIGWFDDENHSVERIYTRLACDAPFIKVAIGTRLGTAVSAIVSLTAAIIISLILEWQLGLIVLSAAPILMGTVYIQAYLYQYRQMRIARQMEKAIRLATKSIQHAWTVQALGIEPLILRRFKDLTEPALVDSHKQSLVYSLIFSITECLTFVVFAGVFRVGAFLIDTQDMNPIYLFKIFIVLAFCSITVGHVTSFTPDYIKGKLAMAHIYSLYELVSTIDAFEEDGEKPDCGCHIVFNNVKFSYPQRPNAMILQGVSFDLPPKTTLGIIGSTGGKTTLLRLLERFYDIDSGELDIDGVEMKKMKLDYLRSNIGYVQQEPILFNRSISDNISYGYSGDEEDEDLLALIKGAADDASVTEFAMKLPHGFLTPVGENGILLTGGQRQKIAIARALMRNPEVLLLDEPTSALDPEDELVVQNALLKAKVGRTMIIASNRPSIVKIVDVVAVLVNGKIAEFGTHEQLMELKGFYHEFMKASQNV